MTIYRAVPRKGPHVRMCRGRSDDLRPVRPSAGEFLRARNGMRALKEPALVAQLRMN